MSHIWMSHVTHINESFPFVKHGATHGTFVTKQLSWEWKVKQSSSCKVNLLLHTSNCIILVPDMSLLWHVNQVGIETIESVQYDALVACECIRLVQLVTYECIRLVQDIALLLHGNPNGNRNSRVRTTWTFCYTCDCIRLVRYMAFLWHGNQGWKWKLSSSCNMAHSDVWHDLRVTHSYVWHDSWLVHTRDITCVTWRDVGGKAGVEFVQHGPFICVTWFAHMCDMTHS